MNKIRKSFSNRLKSFTYAFNGLIILFLGEPNSRIHALATVLVLSAGFFFKVSTLEWLMLIFAIGLVFCLEIINTSIEHIANFVSPDRHEAIKKIKDLAAAAVLIGALTSMTIGLIIFIPKIASF